MKKKDIILELQEICRDVFDDDELTLEMSTSAEQVEEWDSMNHIKLIVEIEKHFKFKFNLTEIRDVEVIGDIVSVIENKLTETSK